MVYLGRCAPRGLGEGVCSACWLPPNGADASDGLCDHVAAARGSFATLDRVANNAADREGGEMKFTIVLVLGALLTSAQPFPRSQAAKTSTELDLERSTSGAGQMRSSRAPRNTPGYSWRNRARLAGERRTLTAERIRS